MTLRIDEILGGLKDYVALGGPMQFSVRSAMIAVLQELDTFLRQTIDAQQTRPLWERPIMAWVGEIREQIKQLENDHNSMDLSPQDSLHEQRMRLARMAAVAIAALAFSAEHPGARRLVEDTDAIVV